MKLYGSSKRRGIKCFIRCSELQRLLQNCKYQMEKNIYIGDGILAITNT
jgi:hypothetical protein